MILPPAGAPHADSLESDLRLSSGTTRRIETKGEGEWEGLVG